MKQLLTKILLVLAFAFTFSHAEAQIFGKKMPVGVKSYSYLHDGFPMEFKDLKGSLDQYDFNNLDTSLKTEKLIIVLDPKGFWRIPLTLNESMGIAEKEGVEPLQRLEVLMGIIKPAIRQKIE